MIFPRKEFRVTILFAIETHKCLYMGCHKVGDFHLTAQNTKGQYICDFPNICDMHIIHVFVETLSEE